VSKQEDCNVVVKLKGKSELKYISINFHPIVVDDRVMKIRGTCLDITDIHKSELEIKKTSEQIFNIQKIAKIGFIEIFEDDKINFSDNLKIILESGEGIKSLDEYNNFIHPDDRETIKKTIEKSISNRYSYNIQYRLRLESGKIKYVNEICSIDSNKSDESITRVIQDITDIKEKELVINKISEVQVSTLLGSWEYNFNDNRFYLNDALQKLLNSSSNSITFDEFVKYIHIDDRYSVSEIIKKAIIDKDNFSLSYRLYLNDEIIYIQNYSTFHTSYNGDNLIYGIVRDISEYRNKINTYNDTTELFKVMCENPFLGVFIYQDGKRVFSNNRWAEMVGADSVSLSENMEIEKIYKPETVEFIKNLFRDWDKYKMTEYINRVDIHPINTSKFTVELNVKEVFLNNKKSFLALARPC
jgi:PAS domain-containing protein